MVALQKSSLRTFARPEPRVRQVAVVLNTCARKVDDQTLQWIRSVVPHEHLYLSNSLDDLAPICEMLVARQYDAVLWGGGDGTFVRGVGALMQTAASHFARMPEVGVLRLGTGNAVAETLGSAEATPDGLSLDLSRARAHARRRELTLLDIDGQPSVFAGFGLDSQILDDHGRTVDLLKSVGLGGVVQNANLRYFLSVTGMSLPRFVLSPRTEVIAINRGEPAIRIDVDGRPIGAPIPAGRVLWRGQATLASCASVPFYGLGLKMFPHAQQRADRFQLRMSNVSAVEILSHLREVWRGHYQGKHVHDFLCDSVELVLSKPAPFQSGGDLVGDRSRMTIGIHPQRVSVV
jgi:diacylglycerol kinase family enzyme